MLTIAVLVVLRRPFRFSLQLLYSCLYIFQLCFGVGDGFLRFKLGYLFLDLLDIFQLLILGVVFGENIGVFHFEFVQGLPTGVGGDSLVRGDRT